MKLTVIYQITAFSSIYLALKVVVWPNFSFITALRYLYSSKSNFLSCRWPLPLYENTILSTDVTSVQSVSEQPVRIVVCTVLLHLIELEDEENLTKRSWQCCGERISSPPHVSRIRLISFSCSTVASIPLFHSIFSVPPPFPSFFFSVFLSFHLTYYVYTVSHFLQVSLTFNFPLKRPPPLFALHPPLWRVGSQFLWIFCCLLLPPHLSFCWS